MQRLYFPLSILILTRFLTGCAPKAVSQPEQVKALENPTLTDLREKLTPIETPTSEVVPHDPPASCPITVLQDPPFLPPAPYDSMGFEGEFWYGSNSLWTAVRKNGIWEALPHNPEGYTQKVFWWRDGYVWNEEPEPELTVTGERLDAPAPALNASKATNALRQRYWLRYAGWRGHANTRLLEGHRQIWRGRAEFCRLGRPMTI